MAHPILESTETNKKRQTNCPHCGNNTLLEVKSETTTVEEVNTVKGEILEMENYYVIAECKRCGGISIYASAEYFDNPDDLNSAILLYPQEKSLEGVPQKVKESYAEAKRIKKISPYAFAVMIRRAMEFLCKDQNAQGKNLNSMLKDLSNKEIIPKTLSEMTDVLRILGNLGAHASDTKIDMGDVNILNDFFLAVVEYIYTAPEKIKRYKESLLKKNKS